MAFFSSNFSFEAPSSRPETHYTYGTSLDEISPTSSRCGSPSSPTSSIPSSTSSANSSTDDLYNLTSHLSTSSLYSSSSRFLPPGRRSPPRSTPFSLPPNSAQQSCQSSDLLARRERRQAYVTEQLSSQSRRKLSLLVARMLGDEISPGSRRHPNDGLHPSNVRVVPAMPGSSKSRRNTLAEVRPSSSDEEAEEGPSSSDDYVYEGTLSGRICESIEMDLPVRQREAANRISKRSLGRSSGRKVLSRSKK